VARLLGLPSAERMLSVALDIAQDAGPRSCEARAQLALGQLYAGRGKLALARANLEDAASIARRSGDAVLHVQCLEALGALVLDEGEVEQARAIFQRGLAAAGENRALAARMMLGLANHALRSGDPSTAVRLLQEALPSAEAAGDRVLVGRIVNNIGIALIDDGKVAEALTEFRRALELRRGLGYRTGEVINLHNIGDALLRLGDHAHAWAAFEQSRELARECAWDRGVVLNDVFLVYLRGVRGEAVEVELTRAEALADKLGEPEAAFTARWFRARLVNDSARILQIAEEARAAGFATLARQIEAG
jgi:tetratricopeptide (TPR) repeat protein